MASSASNDNLNSGVWLKFNENLFFGEAHFLERGIGVAGEAVTGGGEHHGGQTLLVQVEDFVVFVRLKVRSCGLRAEVFSSAQDFLQSGLMTRLALQDHRANHHQTRVADGAGFSIIKLRARLSKVTPAC
jgi:hypothetical protein